ncbi:MAG: deoxyribonuclease IV [Frankiaceae bacterium]
MGAHVFAAGGLGSRALAYARAIGAEAVQVFVSNPRGWARSAGDARQDERFRAGCVDDGRLAFVHAPYLVNLASPSEETLERSVACLRHALARAAAIGAAGVVFHAGSTVVAGRRDAALASSRELLLPLLDEAAAAGVRLLVEPTAGGGAALAATVDELASYLDAVDGGHQGLGACVDTCHLFAAGHDVATPGGMRATLTALGRAVGPGRLGLVHANDSKDPCGSRRDRHEALGSGRIGLEPFGELFRHPATRGVPVLIETPGERERHASDVATLKALRDR